MLAQATRRAQTIRAWVNAAVMPLSLKLPEGFIPSYWSQSEPGFEADVAADLVGALEQGLALADRDDLVGGGERQQLAEPPDAREVQRVERGRPTWPRTRASRRGTGSRSQS